MQDANNRTKQYQKNCAQGEACQTKGIVYENFLYFMLNFPVSIKWL